ncbi:MAG: hypothetical protein WA397_05185 [Roseiarcus sp.]
MAARAAIALSLAALAWTGSAQAQDDPACAQYREPMAYNLCLARHGPKANSIGKPRGPQPGQAGQNRVWYGQAHRRAPAVRFYSQQDAHRVHGRMHMEFRLH